MADYEEAQMAENMAIKILNQLKKEGKLGDEVVDQTKQQFTRLHDLIEKTLQNQKTLHQKTKKMQVDLKQKNIELENEQTKSEEKENQVKKAQTEVKKSEQQEEKCKKEKDQFMLEFEKYEQQKQEMELTCQEDVREIRNRISKDEEELNQTKDQLHDFINRKKVALDGDEKHLQDQVERILSYKKENDERLNEKGELQNKIFQIKDEPIRLGKKADMLFKANTVMQKDYEDYKDEISKKEKIVKDMKSDEQLYSGKCQDARDEGNKRQLTINELDTQIKLYNEEVRAKGEQKQNMKEEIYKKDILKKDANAAQRRVNEDINKTKKEIDHLKKEYKKEESMRFKLKEEIRELEISIDKFEKEQAQLRYEHLKQDEVKNNVGEDAKLTEYKKRKIEGTTKKKDEDKLKIDKQIEDLEGQLKKLQDFELGAQKKVKMLTAMRESMARKASSAMAEVRETREEMKIKELLILDLTKKYQETEFKLNSFKALYEEVKSDRNKYVNLIQNSSQDLAELKERIKILQNELEILKNESQEKDSTLMQYKHILQREIHNRDRAHAKLDKQEYKRKEKKEQVDQNINEIEKLNTIIMGLEKDMLILRKKYEQACESRNYTGIQLIDRNDELCILYEKANIQETVLKNGEVEVKKREDDIRMIKIEINENKRRIDVARKQIIIVPKLADKIIEHKGELEIQQAYERQLSEQLEDPANLHRWNELTGDDPDEEALDAKIHVLEERLNNKKEQLLEKELILDEITNLSEKLRRQALEGRQSTLELSEKLNDFQTRLKDITRKMMASISELSMFQATQIKLQQEREELDKVFIEAKTRIDEGMAPTPETEIEYLKSIRDKKRYEEERNWRLQKQALEQNFPPFATKTTAEHRVNAYIPNEIGLPKPYGKHAPFKPSLQGVNMRHIRKPIIKEIEIQ